MQLERNNATVCKPFAVYALLLSGAIILRGETVFAQSALHTHDEKQCSKLPRSTPQVWLRNFNMHRLG